MFCLFVKEETDLPLPEMERAVQLTAPLRSGLYIFCLFVKVETDPPCLALERDILTHPAPKWSRL